MGRKKRTKVIEEEAPPLPPPSIIPNVVPPPTFAPPPSIMPPPPPPNVLLPPADPRIKQETKETSDGDGGSIQIKSATIKKVVELDEADLGTKPSSMYGLHSHAGDLVEDDIYVSDGSLESDSDDDEDDDNADEGDKKTKKTEQPKLELVLTTSKMGLMRRGGISSLLGQPVNRTWVRNTEGETDAEGGGGETTMNQSNQDPSIKQEEEEEIITDPAILLQIQQRKIEQAKQNARILESSENAGRDPCLFSKRTAFDIRMDQIEDKPWDKGGDITDYMNYGLTEEDWIEYAERQLAVRQELTDAAKQKRLPDPGVVPVVPRAPTKQVDRVAVRVKKDENAEDTNGAVGTGTDSDDEDGIEMIVESGPKSGSDEKDPSGVEAAAKDAEGAQDETLEVNSDKVIGGAWGAGAKEDSVLIRLIQEQSGQAPPPMIMGAPGMMGMPPPNMMPPNMMPPNMMMPPPPPPPAMNDDAWRRDAHQDRHSDDGQWRRDAHNQGPPNDRGGRFDGPRDGRGHPDVHWEQHSSPNFRQQPPPFRRGPPPPHGGPPGDFRGPPPDRFHQQWGPGRGGPGRGRGDWGGPGRGGGAPPQWDNRKRPRDFDRGGRW